MGYFSAATLGYFIDFYGNRMLWRALEKVDQYLAKVGVEGSNPFARSKFSARLRDIRVVAGVNKGTRRIWDVRPTKSPSNAASDSECFNYGEILQQAAKTFPERAKEFQEGALTSFSDREARHIPTQKQGQLLVEMGRCQGAKVELEAIPDLGTKPFALYWLSKAQTRYR